MKLTMAMMLLPLFLACAKGPEPVVHYAENDPFTGKLVINEVVAEKTMTLGEFGEPADRFELYNTGSEDLLLKEGEWFVSDAGPDDPKKFKLPETLVPARTTVLVWCDKVDDTSLGIHTNFALAASGEHIVLYHQVGGVGTVIDEVIFAKDGMPGPVCARYPDGVGEWVLPKRSTPGATNEPARYAATE